MEATNFYGALPDFVHAFKCKPMINRSILLTVIFFKKVRYVAYKKFSFEGKNNHAIQPT